MVNEQVAGARVDGSGEGKPNDNACDNHQYNASQPNNLACRGGSPRGNNSGGIDLRRLRRCEIVCAASTGFESAFKSPQNPERSASLALSARLSGPNGVTYQRAPPSTDRGSVLTQSSKTAAEQPMATYRNRPHHAGRRPEHPQRPRSKHLDKIEWGGFREGEGRLWLRSPVRVFLESFGRRSQLFGDSAERSSVVTTKKPPQTSHTLASEISPPCPPAKPCLQKQDHVPASGREPITVTERCCGPAFPASLERGHSRTEPHSTANNLPHLRALTF